MDISLFYDYECVVRCGSISDAAKERHMTQSALSKRMNLFEKEIGLELFERTTPIQLTRMGEIVLEYSTRINAEYYKLLQHVERLHDRPLAVIHVAGLYSKRIGPVAKRVKQKLESDNCFIDIKQETNLYSEPNLDLLRAGKLQVSIEPFSPELNLDGLIAEPLVEEDVYAILAKDNPVAEKGYFDASDLPRMRFTYARSSRTNTYNLHLRWLCKVNGLIADTPRSIFVSNALTERDLFLTGIGNYAMMCPKSMAEILLATSGPEYCIIPFKGKHARYDMRIIYAEDAHPKTLEFVEAFKAELAASEAESQES